MSRDAPASSAGHLTLRRGGGHEHTIEIEKSIFVTHLERVDDEEAARQVIAARRKLHPDAGHHCSAFVLGPTQELRRSSDDGEPSGTAGVPMLQVLLQRRVDGYPLSGLVAVVSRWFGGTKLGAGGLVRAYTRSVSESLDGAPLVLRQPRQQLRLERPMATAGRDESVLRAAGLGVLGQDATPTDVVLTLDAPAGEASALGLSEHCAALLGREVRLERLGEVWADRPLA